MVLLIYISLFLLLKLLQCVCVTPSPMPLYSCWCIDFQQSPTVCDGILHVTVPMKNLSAAPLLQWNHLGVLWGIPLPCYRLVGLVVMVSASRAQDLVFNSSFCCGDFSGSSHTSDFKTGSPVAALPGAWRYRVSAGTSWPGVSTRWGGEVESSATSVSLGQHVNVPEQICSWNTLACCGTLSNQQTSINISLTSLVGSSQRHQTTLEEGLLKAWPSQPHLLLVWQSRECCPALLWTSLLVTLSYHCVWSISPKHVSTKACGLRAEDLVVCQVSLAWGNKT